MQTLMEEIKEWDDVEVRAARASVPAVPTAEQFRAVVVAVRRFLLANADRIPHDEEISHQWLTDYIVFHAVRGTLAVVWGDGVVQGVAIAWQMHEADLRTADAAGRDVFAWRPNDPTGDCVYLCLVVTEMPGAVRTLARYFLESCPMWLELNQFAHRRVRHG